MIDLVIPLGNKSTWDNNELRFCLRSIEKNLNGIGSVHIISDYIPEWIVQENLHIHKIGDEFGNNKAKNIANKLYKFCLNFKGKEFLFLNDDYIFNNNCHTDSYYETCIGTLQETRDNSKSKGYRTYCNSTIDLLNELGRSTYDFDSHYPFRVNTKRYIDFYEHFYNATHGILLIRSLYANVDERYSLVSGIEPVIYEDSIIRKDLDDLYINDLRHVIMFSYTREVIADVHSNVRKYLETKFNKKSKYERD